MPMMRTCSHCGMQELPSTTCTTALTLSEAAQAVARARALTERALGLFQGPENMMTISLLGMVADSLVKDEQTIDGVVDALGARR